MSLVSRRALAALLTVAGLVLLALGTWFTINLGSSGSATFTTTPARGGLVVLEPSVLNRVDGAVTVTAHARGGSEVWIGRAAPSDVKAVLDATQRTMVTGAHMRDWTLTTTRSGSEAVESLSGSDIWRSSTQGRGTVRLVLDQAHAPESLVITGADGKAADLSSVVVTAQNRTWFFQSLLAALVGLLATAAGVATLVNLGRAKSSRPTPAEPVKEVAS